MKRILCILALLAGCTSNSKNPEASPREELYLAIEGRIGFWNGRQMQQDPALMQQEIARDCALVAKHYDMLKTDAQASDLSYKAKASFALAFAPDDSALPILIRNFESPSPSVRANSIAAAGILVYRKVVPPERAPVPAYQKLLASKSWEDQQAALYALSLILSEDNDYGLNGQILPLMTHPRLEVRNEAVKLVSLLRKADSYEPLKDRLHDPEPLIRMLAIAGLSRIAKEKAIPDIMATAMTDGSTEVVTYANEEVARLAPKGVEFACDTDNVTQSSSGSCPKCGKPLLPRPRR
jgi:hypothetical protein